MTSATRVLVVRAWTEDDGSLRVRLSGQLAPDGETDFQRVAADADTAALAVREWLATFDRPG